MGLLWASPDCKHFSKAKGGKPVDKNIRGLAWIVLAVGRNRAPPGDHPGECGGVPDVGTCTARAPGEIKDRADLPAVC